MMTRISIDQNECIGCNFCTDCAPGILKFDEKELKAKLNLNGNLVADGSLELTEEQTKKAKEAAEGCPVKAIQISE